MNWTKGNLGLDRSGLRAHVQRQERRADPPPAPGGDRAPAGADLQAEHRHRYSADHIVSHSDLRIRSDVRARSAATSRRNWIVRTEVIGIDEAQFLGMELVDLVVRLADMGKRIIIAGLDTDYLGRPFDPIPELLAVADDITKTLAICMQCGNPAKHTQRLVASEDLIVVGDAGDV